MLPDALPQLMDTLLRLPHLDTAQLRELIQHLPDPQASAAEMVRRGWITPDQFSSLFPDPQERPAPRETMLVGLDDDPSLPETDCEDWSLPISDGEILPKPETVEAVTVLSVAARTPQHEWDMQAPLMAVGSEVRQRESDADKFLKPWMGWASKGLLMGTLFFGSVFAGVQFFGANSPVPPGSHQGPREANAGDLATAVDLAPVLRIVPNNNANQPIVPRNGTGPNEQPAAPVTAEAPVAVKAPARANDTKPKSTASLYERIRQVVRENKTEETPRLGIGDIAYQDVPDDGSILVGMAVTYAPFFNHPIIKSVRPIYQRPDGQLHDGRVCGNPTAIGERVLAKEGYAIGGAAIRAGMGIDGMQLTFMEIGAEGLNPKKTYLSKWLGGYGGSDAQKFVNDGRPIIGIAGMRSNDPNSPAFCLCLVTTQPGSLADADGPRSRDRPLKSIGQTPNGQRR